MVYSSSVDVRPEWVVKEQIPFTSLAKLHYQVGEPEDLAFCGKLYYYDKAYDRVTPRLERPLQKTNKAFRSVTTSDDPIIRLTGLLHLHHSLTTSFVCDGGRAVKMRLSSYSIGVSCDFFLGSSCWLGQSLGCKG